MARTRHGGRGLRRTAAVAVTVLAVGLLPGTSNAVDDGEQPVDREFAYRCLLPGGGGTERMATVRVAALFPRQVPAGRPFRPASVVVGVRLSQDAVADLAALGAARTEGVVRLTALAAQNGASAEVPWSQLQAPETALPAGSAHTIEARGTVPTVTARSGGELVLSAGAVVLDLLVRTADDRPTTPPNLSVTCTPEAGQDTAFAGVAVVPGTGSGGRPTPPAVDDPDEGQGQGEGQDGPGGATDQPRPGHPGAADGRTEKGEKGEKGGKDGRPGDRGKGDCVENPPFPLEPVQAHGYLAGYSNVHKLGGAVRFQEPGLLRVNMLKAYQLLQCSPPEGPYFALYSDVRFDHGGKPQLPPAASTFLTFGFMPTTATVELTAAGPMEIVTRGYQLDEQGRQPEISTVTGKVWIRLYGVQVNGTPLDVGPACRTARPMDLVMTGRGHTDVEGRPHGYTVAGGGPLTATGTFPEFSGCGVGEDLDALLTAALSGPGNYIKMTQGPLCAPGTEHCPNPPKPRPER
ncbi:DUF6801 domain-containing protein [Streptomyces sp. NRRL S-118]|uniref:DUF6801 domain-containing protein n=1 Tax=Streptomyces sp. NRRL S-118 TaxID=1463881 RepID=UPI0006933E3B|nr:DUF6801 domain-containing protein [Streptomyces sp. NRRL S-118]